MSTLIKRYFFFILGLIINSFGVAFITKSALGTSQISSIPYVLSLKFTNLSFGQTTFIFNMLFILIQLLILKKDFRPIQFLQIAANILFSSFIDVSMTLLTGLNPQTIPLRTLSLLVGCAILAVGISVEVAQMSSKFRAKASSTPWPEYPAWNSAKSRSGLMLR